MHCSGLFVLLAAGLGDGPARKWAASVIGS
jgi:hypothetical protein